ncbi:MAG TPA: AGE family epimerase/isomerase [Candidatus Binatia bacterium]|nr:AGE family epimerase/isomerase [Candidatus Binatia bacterium]
MPLPVTPTQIEAILRRHVIDVWFPRCLDERHGGFLCDFDRRWRSCGPHDKFLEFQARQTMFAAEAVLAFPADDGMRAAMRCGFACLRDVLWDAQDGGWFHRCDRAGTPIQQHTKHVHGMAYAMQACAAVYRAGGDASALPLAQQAFDWLDHTAHDSADGGYRQFFTRDGKAIDAPRVGVWNAPCDPIETPLGCKDANTHSDLLEALTALYAVWPDARVRERLVELTTLCTGRMVGADGAMHFYFSRDWKPVPHLQRYGTALQTATRLMAVTSVLGSKSAAECAERILAHSCRYGRDAVSGGFVMAGPGSAPLVLQGQPLSVRIKPWWVQIEGLRALLHFTYAPTHAPADPTGHAAELAAAWRFVERNMIDERYGGVYSNGRDALPWWRQRPGMPLPQGLSAKGHVWKDASHEGRLLLQWLAFLRKVPSAA